VAGGNNLNNGLHRGIRYGCGLFDFETYTRERGVLRGRRQADSGAVQQPDIRFLSARLKALRKIAGITQEEAAERAGVTYKSYQTIEAGRGRKQEIWLSTVGKLANAFGVGAWELLAPTMPKPRVKKRANSAGKSAGD